MVDTGVTEQTSSRTKRARTWFVAGVLLLAASVLNSIPLDIWFSGSRYVSMALTTAALLLFAIGFDRSGSVTARRPLGTVALVALALWTPIFGLVEGAIFAELGSPNASLGQSLGVGLIVGSIEVFVRFALAMIALSQIARSGVVPRPWNWAPVWVLAVTAVFFVLQYVVGLLAGGLVGAVSTFVSAASPVFIGVLAIVLADRARRSVAVDAHVREPEELDETEPTR